MDQMEDAAELIEGGDETEDRENREHPKLESTTRVLEIGGRAILIAYGIGFFVDSYFDAKYGVTYLNPFRSRVAFTGIALLIQVALILLVFTGEAIWRLASTFWDHCLRAATGVRQEFYRMTFGLCWLIEATFLGLLMRFALTQRPRYIGALIVGWVHGLWSAGGSGTVDAGTTDISSRAISFQHPILVGVSLMIVLTIPNLVKLAFQSRESRRLLDISAGVTLVGGVVFLWAEMQGQDSLAYSFILYILLVRFGMMAFERDRRLRRPEPRLVIVALVIAIPVLYAERMYTNILPQWGGAPKIKLLIRFEHQMVPFGCTAPAYLLEETEEGYYLLRPDSDTVHVAQGQQFSMAAISPTCAPPSTQDAKPSDSAEQQPAIVFDPRLYSAIFVPGREVFQVLYERTDEAQ